MDEIRIVKSVARTCGDCYDEDDTILITPEWRPEDYDNYIHCPDCKPGNPGCEIEAGCAHYTLANAYEAGFTAALKALGEL